MTRSIFYLFVLLMSPLTAVGAEHYCTYFGGVSKNLTPEQSSMFQLENNGCVAGDALRLVIYDRSDSAKGREILYLSEEIAQLCDLNKPITIVGQVALGNTESGAYHAVCTYVGFRRRLHPLPDN